MTALLRPSSDSYIDAGDGQELGRHALWANIETQRMLIRMAASADQRGTILE